MKGYIFNKSILKEYDIRGIVDEDLSLSDAYAIGKYFGFIVKSKGGKTLCVGYDGRISSSSFEKKLVKGLVEAGLKVFQIGLCTTPLIYFSERYFKADGAIMVTGSHNPADHNGFKISLFSKPFFSKDIIQLAKTAEEGKFINSDEGSTKEVSVVDQYVSVLVDDFVKNYPQKKELKVAWDMGNGSVGPVLKKILKHIAGEHILLNDVVDGTFPVHHPDPVVPENLKQLQSVVLNKGCDFGIAFDGDGDRVCVVDSEAKIIFGDKLLIMYAEEVLSKFPGSIIIGDVKSTSLLIDKVKSMGGTPLIWKTGHSLIKQKMLEINSLLAGEMSGHIYFKDRYYGFDDAIYAALRLIGYFNEGNNITEKHKQFTKFISTPEIRIPCDYSKKFCVVKEVRDRIKKKGRYNYIDVDGIRVSTEIGWWLLRASNTENHLVARIEAKDDVSLDILKKSLINQLSQSGIKLNL